MRRGGDERGRGEGRAGRHKGKEIRGRKERDEKDKGRRGGGVEWEERRVKGEEEGEGVKW